MGNHRHPTRLLGHDVLLSRQETALGEPFR
jgi:hypothetical protein